MVSHAGKRQDAPGGLEEVRAFVNTWDLERGTDVLADLPGLAAWSGLTGLGEPDRLRAVEVREALRTLAGLNTGQEADPAHAAVLDALAADADVRIRFPGGLPAPRPGTGLIAVLGGLLAAVGVSVLEGTWARLRVCPAADCRWAFYDHSRNRSGVWCQMAECGNREKARAFRRRHVAETRSAGDDA
ncbi:CGNR zinc finger domain-containing protein [Actinocorallia longicatena]|uniref:CGNR zinc finger domain-containing protein n=1 Tax=Actinocorallia longicatena TaxID=111803 RepID=A0ABP6PVU5_9ACTN